MLPYRINEQAIIPQGLPTLVCLDVQHITIRIFYESNELFRLLQVPVRE